jgi:hypothetical protein
MAWDVPYLPAAPGVGGSSTRAPFYRDHARLLVVRDGKASELPVTALVDWRVGRDHVLFHFQDVSGPLPGGERRVPLELQVVSTTDQGELSER